MGKLILKITLKQPMTALQIKETFFSYNLQFIEELAAPSCFDFIDFVG